MSLREFYAGFAMEILISGVMDCRINDGFVQVFCGLYTGVMIVSLGLRMGSQV